MIIGGMVVIELSPAAAIKRRIAGRVTVNGAGSSKRVVVQKRGTLEYVASTHSKTDGTWEIKGMPELPEKSLIVMVIDDADPGRNILIFDKESQVE